MFGLSFSFLNVLVSNLERFDGEILAALASGPGDDVIFITSSSFLLFEGD